MVMEHKANAREEDTVETTMDFHHYRDEITGEITQNTSGSKRILFVIMLKRFSLLLLILFNFSGKINKVVFDVLNKFMLKPLRFLCLLFPFRATNRPH